MSRQNRIQHSVALYHVTSRGNRQKTIYHDDYDRDYFIDLLKDVVERYGWRCYAYCLMNNHYHLLIETVHANLSLSMRQLNSCYAAYFNRRHETVGHCFQGRFKSILVEKQTYFLELCRYIVLNPVRAHIVDDPEKYTWSSYRATAGKAHCPDFLNVSWLTDNFGEQLSLALTRYQQFVLGGINKPAPWQHVKNQIVLGSEKFQALLEEKAKHEQQYTEIPKQQRFLSPMSLDEHLMTPLNLLNKTARNKMLKSLHREHGYKISELATKLGLHYSTVSRAIKSA